MGKKDKGERTYTEKIWKAHAKEQERKKVEAEKWASHLETELMHVREILGFFTEAVLEDGSPEIRTFTPGAMWGLYHTCILLDKRLDRVLSGEEFKPEQMEEKKEAA